MKILEFLRKKRESRSRKKEEENDIIKWNVAAKFSSRQKGRGRQSRTRVRGKSTR